MNHNEERVKKFTAYHAPLSMQKKRKERGESTCEKDTQMNHDHPLVASPVSIQKTLQHLLHKRSDKTSNYVREFAQDEQLYPKSGRTGTVECFGVETEIFWDGIIPEVMDELWEDPAEPNGRKDRKS